VFIGGGGKSVRRVFYWISLTRPSNFRSLRILLTSNITAGREGGALALVGSRAATVFALMPFTRQLGLFLGFGVTGRGSGADLRLELEMALSSVSRGAPGSSLETRSKRVMAWWIALGVGAAAARLGSLGLDADVAAAAA
jgi:hypothetical protein